MEQDVMGIQIADGCRAFGCGPVASCREGIEERGDATARRSSPQTRHILDEATLRPVIANLGEVDEVRTFVFRDQDVARVVVRGAKDEGSVGDRFSQGKKLRAGQVRG